MKNRAIKKAKRRNLGTEVIRFRISEIVSQSVQLLHIFISWFVIQPLAKDNAQ